MSKMTKSSKNKVNPYDEMQAQKYKKDQNAHEVTQSDEEFIMDGSTDNFGMNGAIKNSQSALLDSQQTDEEMDRDIVFRAKDQEQIQPKIRKNKKKSSPVKILDKSQLE